jgi:hypothetical protein
VAEESGDEPAKAVVGEAGGGMHDVAQGAGQCLPSPADAVTTNAPLTAEGRRRMVSCVLDKGWTIEATADRLQVDAKTVRKWRDRLLVERDAGLQDRSSRPHRSPNRTRAALRKRCCICVGSVAGRQTGWGCQMVCVRGLVDT